MPVITFNELASSPNQALIELKNQTYAPPFAIVPHINQQGEGGQFDKDYDKRHFFTILKYKNGEFTLGRKIDVKQYAQYRFSQSLFQTFGNLIADSMFHDQEIGFKIQTQNLAEYCLDSLVIQFNGSLSYINCLIGVRFIIDAGMAEFYELNGALGCVKTEYIFRNNHYFIDKIYYTGNVLFEKIIQYAIIPTHENKEFLRAHLFKGKNERLNKIPKTEISDEDFLNRNIKKLSYVYSQGPRFFNTKKILDTIYEECVLKTATNMNTFGFNKNLSLKRIDLMEFLFDILRRLFINKINPQENQQIIVNILKIFQKINKHHTDDLGNILDGKGKFNQVLQRLITYLS